MRIIEGDEDDLVKFDMVSREMCQTLVEWNLGDTKIGDSNNANPSYQEVPDTNHKGFSSINSMCTYNAREESKRSIAGSQPMQANQNPCPPDEIEYIYATQGSDAENFEHMPNH